MTTNQNTRTVIMRAFSIQSRQSLTSNSNDIFLKIKNKLDDGVAEDRIMLLNQNDQQKESDLLSDFKVYDDDIFYTMMRIADGDDGYLDKEVIKKKTISLNDIKKRNNNVSALYRDHYYICLNKNFLVTNLNKKYTITRVETYLNWLLKTKIVSLIPCIKIYKNLKLTDINKITFNPINLGDNNTNNDTDNYNIVEKLKTVGKKAIKTILLDDNSVDEIAFESIVYATLILGISKPKNITDEQYKKSFGALLKPISDLDYLTFYTKREGKINGEKILLTKPVDIELTENGMLSEPQLYQEMSNFLQELEQ